MSTRERVQDGILQRSQQDPSLSGNGEKLAFIVDKRGRPTVELRDLRTGKTVNLRSLSRNQPHSSPSLSWNGRYLAVITQRGNRRLVVVEDRLTARTHLLPLPGEREAIRVSLAPDASQLALQVAVNGKWRVELFDLSQTIEPDLPSGLRLSTPSLGIDP